MTASSNCSPANGIDPQIREFARQLNAAYRSYGAVEDLSERRYIAEQVRRTWRIGGPKMVRSQDLTVNGLRARLHRPNWCEKSPAMLYIHGGGWMLFSIDTHDRLMREYAARAGIAVLGIDYSLSPEVKFPVAVNEIFAALQWMEAHGDALNLDTARLFIGGDSAGANLAVSACLMRREIGLRKVTGMVLNYGAFDPKPTASYALYSGPDHTLDAEEMTTFWEAYIGDLTQPMDPLAAPLRADLHDLPPTFLAIAEQDILADGNRAFAARLRHAGTDVVDVTYPGATHSFLEAVSIAPLASRALDDQAAWVMDRCKKP